MIDLIGLALLGVAMIASPGPANMVLMTAGAEFGLRRALPFVFGVAMGKQLVIWPVGLGLLAATASLPGLATALAFLSAAYLLWLAWRIAGARIVAVRARPPRFAAGLVVHPLNPKAWALVTSAFGVYAAGAPPLLGTLIVALTFLAIQLVFHPLWCWGGARLAHAVAGTQAERALMICLAALTVASVVVVLVNVG
ncbi:MAG: LysE family transporter [Pseudomonadota bacterium]